MTFPTIPSGYTANQALGSYANLRGYLNALAAAQDGTTGRRNALINGDFAVHQRDATHVAAVTANAAFVSDRWWQTFVGSTMSTVPTLRALGTEPKWKIVTTTASNDAAGDYAIIVQNIEGVERFAGKNVSISFTAYAGSGTPSITFEASQSFGTGGSPSAAVNTTLGKIAITTTESRYKIENVAIPSIAGKTLGTSGTDFVALYIWLSAGSDYNTRTSTLGYQNNTFHITDIQIEEGPVATPFERLPQAEQLVLCQRFYEQLGPYGAGHYFASGYATSGTSAYFVLPYARKRAAPSISFSAVDDFGISTGHTGVNTTNLVASITDVHNVFLTATAASGLTTADAGFLNNNQDQTNAYIAVSAEL